MKASFSHIIGRSKPWGSIHPASISGSPRISCPTALYAKNLTAYENLANLNTLPAKGSWIIALPMKIRGGSGAPLRILALIIKP